MREVIPLNYGWLFNVDFDAGTLVDAAAPGEAVGLPHNAVDLPMSYFDEAAFCRPFLYRRILKWLPEWQGREIVLVFDGAMADARVYLNGELLGRHRDGYTPFEIRLTEKLIEGDNLVAVELDGSENPTIPPFGGQIDYLTYAGLYRQVWLRITAPISIGRVKIETPDALAAEKSVLARVQLANPRNLPLSGSLNATLKDGEGNILASVSAPATSLDISIALHGLIDIALWDLDRPALYMLNVDFGGDTVSERFGFRDARFTPDGFLLNGRMVKIRGINRHQSFPYIGYALGKAAQERDAEILRHQLHVNMVRTSHYPQSRYFLDRCDELGLLVFEEIPGWQHIGDDEWKDRSVDNVRAMIERDWNHPSIVIWGVRINESQDDHDFYTRTNELARALDPTRPTGGVRYLAESELLEDVYTINDFILGHDELGGNRARTALRSRAEVTGLARPVPYLVTEFNGHMFPTKNYDQEQRQVEHVRRHLEVLDAAYGDPELAGAIGWCAFDYNTHSDFGSGDRICYHGVMDMFREPKFAAFAYASQCDPDEAVVLEPVTIWARGERNIGGVLPLMILTNCDAVELAIGNLAPRRLEPDRQAFPNLPHPPVIVDDRHYEPGEIGPWGERWDDATITGYRNGLAVKTVKLAGAPVLASLQVEPDRASLSAAAKDSVRVAIRALDQVGRKLPFLFEPVHIAVDGPARRLGPPTALLRGGSTAFWLETTGGPGEITIEVSMGGLDPVTLHLSAEG